MVLSFREAFGEALLSIGDVYRNLVVIDTDLSKSTRTSYFSKKYPDRFIQVGISEQDAIGTAAGLAIGGKIPVLAIYSMFLLRGWEQIRNTVARDNLNVKIVGTHTGLSDHMDGASHQCFEDIALMRILPNFTVISPSDITSTKSLFKQALEHIGPVYIRLGRDNSCLIYDDEEEIKIGRANILYEGGDLVLISHGAMLKTTVDVSNILKKSGYEATVIDMHTIKPLDKELLLKISKTGKPIFVIEDHSIYGGLGGAIAEYLSMNRPTWIFRIGVDDKFGSGDKSYSNLMKYMGLDPKSIYNKIKVVLNDL